MKKYGILLGLTLSLSATQAMAVSTFGIDKLSGLGQSTFKALSEDMAAALSYKAITPAEPLGPLGFDIGLEATMTELASVDKWGSAIGTTSLSYLPLPKLHLHKGLPLGIDLGAVYSSVPGAGISNAGGEIRYSFVSGNVAIPAVAARLSYTTLLGVDAYKLSNTGLELTVSKGFLFFTPYAGVGNVWSSASSSLSAAGVQVFKDESLSLFKWYVGFNLNMGLMNLAFEMDQTGEAASYSGKLGFRF